MFNNDSKSVPAQEQAVILISTFSDEKSLVGLSKILVKDKKLCACVNYTKVHSMYMWDSNLQQEDEFIAFFKTTLNCLDDLKTEIKINHPYKIPEIVVIRIDDISKEYLSWMNLNTFKNNPNG